MSYRQVRYSRNKTNKIPALISFVMYQERQTMNSKLNKLVNYIEQQKMIRALQKRGEERGEEGKGRKGSRAKGRGGEGRDIIVIPV